MPAAGEESRGPLGMLFTQVCAQRVCGSTWRVSVRASFPLAREVWELSPGLRLRDADCQAHSVPSACTHLVLFLPISLIP